MSRNAVHAQRCTDRIDDLAERLREDWWHLTEDEVQTFAEVVCYHPDELLAALVSVGILQAKTDAFHPTTSRDGKFRTVYEAYPVAYVPC